jgi:hypothetical protein
MYWIRTECKRPPLLHVSLILKTRVNKYIIFFYVATFIYHSYQNTMLSLEEAFGRTALIWMLVSKTTVGGFDLRSSQNKDNKFDICCFMAEHGALTSKSKHCLARRQDNVSVRMEQHVLWHQYRVYYVVNLHKILIMISHLLPHPCWFINYIGQLKNIILSLMDWIFRHTKVYINYLTQLRILSWSKEVTTIDFLADLFLCFILPSANFVAVPIILVSFRYITDKRPDKHRSCPSFKVSYLR